MEPEVLMAPWKANERDTFRVVRFEDGSYAMQEIDRFAPRWRTIVSSQGEFFQALLSRLFSTSKGLSQIAYRGEVSGENSAETTGGSDSKIGPCTEGVL